MVKQKDLYYLYETFGNSPSSFDVRPVHVLGNVFGLHAEAKLVSQFN